MSSNIVVNYPCFFDVKHHLKVTAYSTGRPFLLYHFHTLRIPLGAECENGNSILTNEVCTLQGGF
jgi:hypothetical protein